jgi:hypothetical protein
MENIAIFTRFRLKATMPRDFLTSGFLVKHFFLVSLDMPSKDFKFFGIFNELCDNSSTLIMSMILAKNTLLVSKLVSMTLVNHALSMSMAATR